MIDPAAGVDANAPATRPTSLGPTLVRQNGIWTLDLSDLPMFQGLSVLARALGDLVIEQLREDGMDLVVERSISALQNPELLLVLGVARVKLCTEHEIGETITAFPNQFQDYLRAILGTLQLRHYREALFPFDPATPSRALVFEFLFPEGAPVQATRFVLERILSRRDGNRSYLRITVEKANGRRMDLDSLPHLWVRDLERRTFLAGTTRIAQAWRDWILREAERGRRHFSERSRPTSHTFSTFAKAGLGHVEQIQISWNQDFVGHLLDGEPGEIDRLLKRALLAIEDHNVREQLNDGEIVGVLSGDVEAYLCLMQRGRLLSVSLGERHHRTIIDSFLQAMPATAAVVRKTLERSPGLPLEGVRVLLVHHLTAEVLGLIAALRQLGCRDLEVHFVAYGGEAPTAYLDPLLDLPEDEFYCLSLVNVPHRDKVEGHYVLSSQFSPVSKNSRLPSLLQGKDHYYDAMRVVTRARFDELIERARNEGGRCLVIEDGGYVAPGVNQDCLSRRIPAEHFQPLIGTVEHTRNGFDRLQAVEAEYGQLAFPAYSIAVSKLKLDFEAWEVAGTILNAVENVLNAAGRVLSQRNCVVLGSRGAIGGHLMNMLRNRLRHPDEQLLGVDLKVCGEEPGSRECIRYQDLPIGRRRSLDLVIGVIGACVLTCEDMEDWLLHATRSTLTLASGSTKTEEFSGLARWLDGLLNSTEPRIGGHPVAIRMRELNDTITSRVYGHVYTFRIDTGAGILIERELWLLSNLTPVNFLFYGVPTEVIDLVIAELLSCSLGLLRNHDGLEPRLHAVDKEIDPEGNLLPALRPLSTV